MCGFFPRAFWSQMDEQWAPWHTRKWCQPLGMFRGQFGYAFASRLRCCLVLGSLPSFGSGTGAAAQLRTSLHAMGSTVLCHSCRYAFCRPFFLLLCSSNGLKPASPMSLSLSSMHPLHTNCWSAAQVTKPLPASLFGYPDISNGRSWGRPFILYVHTDHK